MEEVCEELKTLDFEPCMNDSCLMRRSNQAGIVFLVMYVDDCFVIGEKQAVKHALDEIENKFDIKRSCEVNDFVGCHIRRAGREIFLSQPDLIKKLLKSFGNEISKVRGTDIPAPGGFKIV